MYASTDYRKQRVLWYEITRMAALGLPSLIVRDFNCIVDPHEKIGGRQYTNSIDSREFRRFISDLGPINLGYTEIHLV